MKKPASFLVDKKVLPKVYSRVVGTKQCIMSAEAASISEAAWMAGISHNVFYKYKDSVYPYRPEATDQILTAQAVLYDRPGVLMSLVSEFYRTGANILTIDQNISISGKTTVSIPARISNMVGMIDELLALLRDVDGVYSIGSITDQ